MSISFDKAGAVDLFIVYFADLFPGDGVRRSARGGCASIASSRTAMTARPQVGFGASAWRGRYDPDGDEWFVPDAARGEW
jgi:hypothetical protein